MALKPHLWAYDDAPVKNPTAVLVLLALADEAADDGTGACPYIDKLAARARVSTRSVQNYLRDLYQQKIIDIGDQGIAQQRYRRGAGRAPRCWNLNLSATWDSVPEPRSAEEMAAYSPAIGTKPARRGKAAEVQDLHPTDGDLDKQGQESTGVQDLHPSAGGTSGSQLHPRGAASCTPEVQPVAPFLSGPPVPGSVPAPQVRRIDAEREDLSPDGQLTIDGGEELSEEAKKAAAKKEIEDRAFKISRSWVDYRAEHNKPVVASNPVKQIQSLVLPFLRAEYTDKEVKNALARIGEGYPSKAQMQRELDAIRDGRPAGSRPNQRRGSGGNVNEYWDRQQSQPGPATTQAAPLPRAEVQTTGAAW